MKTKILTLFMVVLCMVFLMCSSDEPRNTTVIVTGTEQPPPVIPVEPPEHDPVILTLATSNSIKFFDGSVIWTWNTGNVKQAENRVYSKENIVYALDMYGRTSDSRQLPVIPDLIDAIVQPQSKTIIGEIELTNTDIWIVEHISPEEALAAGAQYKPYTRLYLNNNEYGNWYVNDFEVDTLLHYNDDIYVMITTGAWKCITGNKENVRLVIENGFALYDYNSTLRTATIDGVSVSWSTNFFNSSKYWLKSGFVWYSQNGYSWDGVTLVENGLAMADWRTSQNLIITAGTRYENSEDVCYFVNCATGYVIRYVPSVNQYTEFVRLYVGDGSTEIGTYYRKELKPIIIDDDLFFIYDAQVYKYNFTNGLTSLFTSGVTEVLEY